MFPLLLDNLSSSLVFVDNTHIIRYMNAAARKKYAKYGEIVGKSILFCHNENSSRLIKEYHEKMKSGADEFIISSKENSRAYMRSVRSPEGELLGYYEITYLV
jgi:DUF438 domain-containing protein